MKFILLMLFSFNVFGNDTLKDFIGGVDIVSTSLDDRIIYIGHTPELLHSARLLYNGKSPVGVIEYSLLPDTYKKIDKLGVPLLKGSVSRVSIGYFNDFSNYQGFFVNSVSKVIYKNYGLAVKASFALKTQKNVVVNRAVFSVKRDQISSDGRVFVYYFQNIARPLFDWDFLSYYVGFYSDILPVDLNKSIESFKDSIKKGQDNLVGGFIYSYNVAKPYYVSLESNFKDLHSIAFHFKY